jgi:adenylate cyclase
MIRSVLPRPQAALVIAAALAALVWGIVLAGAHLEGRATLLDRLEAPLADLRLLMAGPRPSPDDVVIVALDDETVREAGAYPVPRATVAELVRTLARLEPKALGVDILFVDHGPADGDEALASALRESGAVIAAAALFSREAPGPGEGARADLPDADSLLLPLPLFTDAAAIGLVNVTTDSAGTLRFVPLVVRSGTEILPSFPMRVAIKAARADPVFDGDRLRIGATVLHTDFGRSLPLRFYGPHGRVKTISARDVLAGRVDAAALRGRIVVVGTTAVGTTDTFSTPFDPVFPGVEALATAIAHLATGDGLRRDGTVRVADAIAAILLPTLAVLFVGWRRILAGLTIAIVLISGWLAIAVIAYSHGIWLSMALPLAAALPPIAICAAARLWLDRRTERRLERVQDNLSRFHSPVLATRLTEAPDFLAEPVQQEAAVVFIDLSGFTGLSEALGPDRTRSFLKAFHTHVEKAVTDHGGLVLSYMGDGAMIVFGLPEPKPDDPARAVEAALALADDIAHWIAQLPSEANDLGVQIGAHLGPVVFSRLGAESHQHITATGDTVNVASRLLEVAKTHGAAVVFGKELLDRASRRVPPVLSEVRNVAIRGRLKPLAVRLWHPSEDAELAH